MNGQNTRMNSRVGAATISEVVSGFCRAMVFGASSPNTMCRAVMKAKAMAMAIEWAPVRAHVGRQAGEQRFDQCRDGRLAQPAEAEARHGDAELGRRDVAVGLGDRLPDASAPGGCPRR